MAADGTEGTALLPWLNPRARIFEQIVSRILTSRQVIQAELSIESRLVRQAADKPTLTVVARRTRKSSDPKVSSELEPLGAKRPLAHQTKLSRSAAVPKRFGRPRSDLVRHQLKLLVGGEIVGELRVWHLPILRHGDLRRLAREAETILLGDGLRRASKLAQLQASSLLTNAPDPLLILDAVSGRVLQANRRAASLFRRRATDLSRFQLRELFDLPERGNPLKLLGRRSPRGLVWSLKPRGKPPIPVAVSASRSPGPAPRWHLVLRDISREEQARSELLRAKETLGSIAVAGAQLQAQTERSAIFAAIGRELARLGYFSAILLPEAPAAHVSPRPLLAAELEGDGIASRRDVVRNAEDSRAPLWEVAHISVPKDGPKPPPALLTARFDPNQFSPLQRAISRGRPMFSWSHDRAPQSPRLTRGASKAVPDGTIWAPLTAQGAVFGALWVTGATLRPADAEGIAAFARSQDLEAEVERRTRELTLAVRALREVDRRKDNFMANVSHELRTPLVTILGYTQLVLSGRMGPLSDTQRQSLSTVHRNGQKLKDFIDELLDYSRHELTRESLTRETFPVRRAIDQAAAAIYPKLIEHQLTLQTRVARGTPDVFGEQGRVVQVLSNLLTNAERHCSPGGRLWIAAARSGDRVRVSVGDNGEGIPADQRDRVFDRLFQGGDRALAREKGAGLGLGLAIAKSIVEAHGGRIWVDPRRKNGTRFCFDLPAGDAA